jgi:hydrogenase maturation factor HypF (carbamoyltransferase family)
MDIYRNKKDKDLCVCDSCVKDHEIDLSEYEEYPLGECSICGTINEDARIEYDEWSAYLGLK